MESCQALIKGTLVDNTFRKKGVFIALELGDGQTKAPYLDLFNGYHLAMISNSAKINI